MLCAAAAGKDSCQGDSGGPLVWITTGMIWKFICIFVGMPSKAIDCYKSVTGDVGGICLHPDRCCLLGSGMCPGGVYSEDPLRWGWSWCWCWWWWFVFMSLGDRGAPSPRDDILDFWRCRCSLLLAYIGTTSCKVVKQSRRHFIYDSGFIILKLTLSTTNLQIVLNISRKIICCSRTHLECTVEWPANCRGSPAGSVGPLVQDSLDNRNPG